MATRMCIRRLLDSGLDFALYRFPGEQEPHLVLQTKGEAESLDLQQDHGHGAYGTGVTGPQGFVFAPFLPSAKTPVLLIRPDVAVSGWPLIEDATALLPRARRIQLSAIDLDDRTADVEESDSYKVAFRSFKNQLDRQNFQKLVLSFSQLKKWNGSGREDEAFMLALERFPQSMVYLVYTHRGGRWLGCSPELVLEGYGRKWHTVSLAGTSLWQDWEWNEKNIREQHIVSDYIEGQLQSLNARIIRRGPYTVRAGHLWHLRTDYTFQLPTETSPLHILNLLHPTPAICGQPKEEARNFIRLFERNKRMYYGGYLGPLNLRAETNVYLNIRCAQMRPGGRALFFAGGGLTADSRFIEEKNEVKAKLQTLTSALTLD